MAAPMAVTVVHESEREERHWGEGGGPCRDPDLRGGVRCKLGVYVVSRPRVISLLTSMGRSAMS
eukprot:2942209-Rhodomonas_salina.1